MSPSCDNCGSHVSHSYFRVYQIDGRLNGCEHCDELVRRNGKIEEAKASTESGVDPVRYDPEYDA